jgi:hypothetical protein
MRLIYRLLQKIRLFRKLDRLWYIYRFKRRWRRVYREATRIDGISNLFISVCEIECRPKFAASFKRVWNRMPAESKETLQQHWHRLQRRWDGRNTGIPLHLPVVGVFEISSLSPDLGAMLAFASIGGFLSGIEISLDSDAMFFASIFIPIWESPKDCSDEELDIALARRLASYLLWLRNPGPKRGVNINFIYLWHDDTDELVKKWGFVKLFEREHNNR